MIKRKLIIICSLLSLCIVAAILLYFNYECDLFVNLLLGAIASLLTLVFFETIDYFYDLFEFSYLKGEYKRIKIENGLDERNVNTSRKYEDMTNRYNNVNPIIILKYNGNGKYSGELDYEEGHAEFIVNLNKDNKYIGNGIYYYQSKKDNFKQYMPDQGKYEMVVEKSHPIQIYVYFKNLIPSNLAYGYEIWQKTK